MIVANATARCTGNLVVQFVSDTAKDTYKAGNPNFTNTYSLDITPLGDNLVISPPTPIDFGHSDLLTSPPTTAPSMTLTIQNNAWTDPVPPPSDTTAHVTLSITNPIYSFDSSGTVQTTMTLAASANGQAGGVKAVPIYYLRPKTGPYTGTADVGAVNWTLDASDNSCISPQGAGGPSIKTGKAIDLTGQVLEGQSMRTGSRMHSRTSALYSAAPPEAQGFTR